LPRFTRLPGRDLTKLEKAFSWYAQAVLCGCIALSACTGFPEVAALEGPDAPPPPLVPLEGLLPEAPVAPDPTPALRARADALRDRAATIGAP
jgi:hypothetical protein